MDEVTIPQAHMAHDEAEAFAEFIKRAGVSDFRRLARDEDEAYRMAVAATALARAFAEAGFAPR